jgi:PleD family two-component response regulator
VTLSGGVAALRPAHDGPLAFLKAADERLYEAKRTGRNRIVG